MLGDVTTRRAGLAEQQKSRHDKNRMESEHERKICFTCEAWRFGEGGESGGMWFCFVT